MIGPIFSEVETPFDLGEWETMEEVHIKVLLKCNQMNSVLGIVLHTFWPAPIKTCIRLNRYN